MFSLNATHSFSTIDSLSYFGIFIAYSMQYRKNLSTKNGGDVQ